MEIIVMTRYVLDPSQSRFTVQAFAGGMLSAFAHSPVISIRDFTGELRFNPDAPEETTIQVTVKASSLEVTGNVKEKDRQEIQTTMHKEVLETARYPEIHYHAKAAAVAKIADNWYRVQFQGELSLHGVTRPHAVDTQLRLFDGEVRLSGEFSLLHSAFHIKRVTALGGMITVKDEMKFFFEIVGREEAT